MRGGFQRGGPQRCDAALTGDVGNVHIGHSLLAEGPVPVGGEPQAPQVRLRDETGMAGPDEARGCNGWSLPPSGSAGGNLRQETKAAAAGRTLQTCRPLGSATRGHSRPIAPSSGAAAGNRTSLRVGFCRALAASGGSARPTVGRGNSSVGERQMRLPGRAAVRKRNLANAPCDGCLRTRGTAAPDSNHKQKMESIS